MASPLATVFGTFSPGTSTLGFAPSLSVCDIACPCGKGRRVPHRSIGPMGGRTGAKAAGIKRLGAGAASVLTEDPGDAESIRMRGYSDRRKAVGEAPVRCWKARVK